MVVAVVVVVVVVAVGGGGRGAVAAAPAAADDDDIVALLLCVVPASLAGLEEAVTVGQDACRGLATSASLFRHTLGELETALDVLRLREAWAGAPPPNGVRWTAILSTLSCLLLLYVCY